jgi:hypothetical protein
MEGTARAVPTLDDCDYAALRSERTGQTADSAWILCESSTSDNYLVVESVGNVFEQDLHILESQDDIRIQIASTAGS